MADPSFHRRPRHRSGRCPDRGCWSLRTDPDDARHFADPAKWRADRVRLGADRHPHTAVALVMGDRGHPVEPGRAASAFWFRSGWPWRCICFSATRGRARRCALPPTTARPHFTWASTSTRRTGVAWSLGVGITAVAGGLLAGSQSFQPYTGFDFVIVMYAGVVLGGLGSILGAFWGGLVIGVVQQMSTLISALSAAEHRDLRRLPADHLLAAARNVRPPERAHMTFSTCGQAPALGDPRLCRRCAHSDGVVYAAIITSWC